MTVDALIASLPHDLEAAIGQIDGALEAERTDPHYTAADRIKLTAVRTELSRRLNDRKAR